MYHQKLKKHFRGFINFKNYLIIFEAQITDFKKISFLSFETQLLLLFIEISCVKTRRTSVFAYSWSSSATALPNYLINMSQFLHYIVVVLITTLLQIGLASKASLDCQHALQQWKNGTYPNSTLMSAYSSRKDDTHDLGRFSYP